MFRNLHKICPTVQNLCRYSYSSTFMLTETETKKQNQNILKQNSFINILFTYVFEQKQQNKTIAQLCKFEQKRFIYFS